MDLKDIKPGEMLKVLVVDEDDIEEEQWAKVIANEGPYLYVSYFNEISKVYKSAPIFSFETRVNQVFLDNISEHHEGVTDVVDLGFMRIDSNMYALEEDVDMDDSDSEIVEEEDEDEDLDDFVADHGCEHMELPPDHKEIDDQWNRWTPRSDGERRFKDTVDMIEKYARDEMDNQKMCLKTT